MDYSYGCYTEEPSIISGYCICMRHNTELSTPIQEGDSIRLVLGKLWDERQRLEKQGTSEGTLPLTLKCAGHTGVHLESYRGEPGTPEVTEANRDTSREISQRN